MFTALPDETWNGVYAFGYPIPPKSGCAPWDEPDMHAVYQHLHCVGVKLIIGIGHHLGVSAQISDDPTPFPACDTPTPQHQFLDLLGPVRLAPNPLDWAVIEPLLHRQIGPHPIGWARSRRSARSRQDRTIRHQRAGGRMMPHVLAENRPIRQPSDDRRTPQPLAQISVAITWPVVS